jgi:hypothetical protein
MEHGQTKNISQESCIPYQGNDFMLCTFFPLTLINAVCIMTGYKVDIHGSLLAGGGFLGGSATQWSI